MQIQMAYIIIEEIFSGHAYKHASWNLKEYVE